MTGFTEQLLYFLRYARRPKMTAYNSCTIPNVKFISPYSCLNAYLS